MKKLVLFIVLAIFILSSVTANTTLAAKKSTKKSSINAAQIQEMSDTVDKLTTKIYSASLFSPEDNANLINIKIKLDNQMLISPDASLAPLYYKAGNLYKAREYKNEAIDCYQTILENFGDTALAPKALKELNALGVSVNLPSANTVTPQ